MKRYLLFFGERYYPSGGMDDWHGSFDAIKDAQDVFNARIRLIMGSRADWAEGSPYKEYDKIKSDHWYHIFDTETMEVVDRYPEED